MGENCFGLASVEKGDVPSASEGRERGTERGGCCGAVGDVSKEREKLEMVCAGHDSTRGELCCCMVYVLVFVMYVLLWCMVVCCGESIVCLRCVLCRVCCGVWILMF